MAEQVTVPPSCSTRTAVDAKAPRLRPARGPSPQRRRAVVEVGTVARRAEMIDLHRPN